MGLGGEVDTAKRDHEPLLMALPVGSQPQHLTFVEFGRAPGSRPATLGRDRGRRLPPILPQLQIGPHWA